MCTMKAKIKTLGLLHDTCLKEIKPINNGFHFFFSFYLGDNKEYTVELISNEIANVRCTEHYRDNKTNNINIIDLHDVDCIKAEQHEDLFEILLEDIEKGTIIKLNFLGKQSQLIGNIKELKEFWDIDEMAE